MDLRALRRVAAALASAGFAVLRLDFTGLGASEGVFEETTLSTNVADLLAGADHLLSDSRDAAYAGLVIAAWASHYVLEDAG